MNKNNYNCLNCTLYLSALLIPETHYYDAFVIFNIRAQKDFEFVEELIEIYEGPEHNLKLFIPWRDSLPGDAQNTITAEIIEKL